MILGPVFLNSHRISYKTRLIRKTMCETLRGANGTGAVLAFSMMQASAYNTSRVELNTWLVKCFVLKSFFNAFAFKFVKEIESLYKLYKTNNEYFLIHAMEQIFTFDEMYHSTRLRFVEWNISSFTS